jgi:hypothetical protein
MAKVFKVKFIKKIPGIVPEGLEISVTTNGSKPNGTEIKKVLEANGYKIGGGNVMGTYIIED